MMMWWDDEFKKEILIHTLFNWINKTELIWSKTVLFKTLIITWILKIKQKQLFLIWVCGDLARQQSNRESSTPLFQQLMTFFCNWFPVLLISPEIGFIVFHFLSKIWVIKPHVSFSLLFSCYLSLISYYLMIRGVITWLKWISKLELITFFSTDPFFSPFPAPHQGLLSCLR